MDASQAASILRDIRDGLGIPQATFSKPPVKISGGYDTWIYHFRMSNVPDRLSGQLVLRVFPLPNDGHRARKEAAVQNTLEAEGLPVPKVHLTISESSGSSTPFIVMDYVEGETLLQMDEPESSRILGETHARLHRHDIVGVIAGLARQNVNDIFLSDVLHRIQGFSEEFIWATDLVAWLEENKPEERSRSICHGDFHKLNVLQVHGKVTGILDWSNFFVLDPAFDVANTTISFLIIAKYLTAEGDFELVDLDEVIERYLQAYQAGKRLDDTNLGYYLVMRSTMMLFFAALKLAKPYQHPMVVLDLCKLIRQHSGVTVSPADVHGQNGV